MKNSKLFSVLTKEDKKYLRQNMDLKTFYKGDIIYTPLDICEHLNIIIEGQVKLCKYLADGREQILSFLYSDDVFGEAKVFEKSNYVVTVIAEKKTTIGMVHRDVLLGLTQRNRDFTLEFFKEFSNKIEILNNKVEMLSLKTIKQKIARFLLNLSDKEDRTQIKLPYTKQKIAFLLGTSRETISRNFRELEEQGYIKQISRKNIIIYKEKLEDLFL
ncbi:MAG TPA: Crp/Fnr family transcriptional regulator [Eubacteriaceae bacterium]|nr:Crp/Fnr family transcriptional regulator [Eubacteriaceae bacterium]